VYAVIEDGGRQYRVKTGDILDVDRRDLSEGQETIEFDRVLMLGEGEDAQIGTPTVTGAKVIARIDKEFKARKIDVVKFRRRKGYQVKKGHRQRYLRVRIEQIVT